MSRMKLAIVTALLLGANVASAQNKPKYTRQQDVKIDVKLSDRVKPIQVKTTDKKELVPTLNADDVLSSSATSAASRKRSSVRSSRTRRTPTSTRRATRTSVSASSTPSSSASGA